MVVRWFVQPEHKTRANGIFTGSFGRFTRHNELLNPDQPCANANS